GPFSAGPVPRMPRELLRGVIQLPGMPDPAPLRPLNPLPASRREAVELFIDGHAHARQLSRVARNVLVFNHISSDYFTQHLMDHAVEHLSVAVEHGMVKKEDPLWKSMVQTHVAS